ncbi:CBN-ALH-4 protein [Aphelenchoides avenae]|nr:CBN-ALH-4 protein [Aphelenchus avenae]
MRILTLVQRCRYSKTAGIAQLVKDQKTYFDSGATREIEFRKQQLGVLRAALEEHRADVADAVYEDLRHSADVTNAREIDPSIAEIDLALKHVDEWAKPDMKPVEPAGQPFVVKDPRGQVLLIAPRNYALVLLLRPLVSALAAGNVAIVRPSEGTPSTAEVLQHVVERYFDKHYLSIVRGPSEVVTELLQHRFDFIFFTGSPEIGKVVMKAAAEHLTPVALDLGGKCPCFIDSDVDLDVFAERFVAAKWLNSGQTCLDPDYVLTTYDVRPQLVESLERAIHMVYGDDARKCPRYGRIVGRRQYNHLASILGSTKAKVLYKGGEPDPDDLYIPPIILEALPDDATMKDEIFGPILPILTVPHFDDALRLISAGEKPLAAYIFTNDNAKAERFLSETTSGGVTINDVFKHYEGKNISIDSFRLVATESNV